MFDSLNNKLHYDLSFLNVGEKWKPKEDTQRFEMYRYSRELFELVPEDYILKIYPKGLLNLDNNYGEFASFSRLLAYPRLLTLKTVDMVIGESPVISAQSRDKVSETIKDVRNLSQFDKNFKEGVLDYSRFGILLARVFKDENGRAAITAWDPNEWVPVYYCDGTRRIKYNVIGWREDVNKCKIQIHSTLDGSYEERVYEINSDNTLLGIISSTRYNVGTGKRLLFAIPNTPTTTNPLGTNDYVIINSLLQKAIERLQAILRVLDEHADPSMTGPSSLLSNSDDGELVFKTSRYYAVGDTEKDPKYLVWDANLDSSFKAFDKLCEQMYILSEMGSAFLGASGSTGNVVSGTAMRYKMISPLEKARRITNDLTQPLKEIISSMLFIEGTNIDSKDINVAWKDSLPKDPRELVELTKLEAGTNAIKPLIHSLMDNFGIDQQTAEHYISEILKEQKEFDEVSATYTKKGSTQTKGSSSDPTNSQNLGGAENLGK